MSEICDRLCANLYRDFSIPLSELRQEWRRAVFMAKHGDTATPRARLLSYISDRKREHVESKLLEDEIHD